MGQPNRSFVRLLAGAVVIAFVLQVGYVAKVDEPYPALMMPRFGWAGPERTDELTITRPEIVFSYEDGQTRALTQNEVLEPFSGGHRGVVMANILSPLPDQPPQRRRFEPPGWLFPGYKLGSRSRTTAEHIASLKRWLRGRAQTFYAGAAPTRCVVTYYADTHRMQTPGVSPIEVAKSEPTGRFEMDLNASSTP